MEFTGSESSRRVSKGGLGYELVLDEPTCELPSKVAEVLSSSPTRSCPTVSLNEIHEKLMAAEKRRTSLETTTKLNQSKWTDKVTEISQKEKEIVSKKRESINKKMETFKENRDNYLKSIQDKQREHLLALETKRRVSQEETKRLEEQIRVKLESAEQMRESYISALKDRLKHHDVRVSEVRSSLNSQCENQQEEVRDRLEAKLKKATDKRDSILRELQEKMQDHERHVKEVRHNATLKKDQSSDQPPKQES